MLVIICFVVYAIKIKTEEELVMSSLLKTKHGARRPEGTYSGRLISYEEKEINEEETIILNITITEPTTGKSYDIKDRICQKRVGYFLGTFAKQYAKQDEDFDLAQLLVMMQTTDFMLQIQHDDTYDERYSY